LSKSRFNWASLFSLCVVAFSDGEPVSTPGPSPRAGFA
jgi:hypothetical protein